MAELWIPGQQAEVCRWVKLYPQRRPDGTTVCGTCGGPYSEQTQDELFVLYGDPTAPKPRGVLYAKGLTEKRIVR
jgi:hypothetical protein